MAITDKPLEGTSEFTAADAGHETLPPISSDAMSDEVVEKVEGHFHYPQRRSLKEFSKWEASKHSTQGLLDGALTYGGMGLLAGLALATLVVAAGPLGLGLLAFGTVGSLSIFGAVAAATTALSSVYGMHEWKENGRVGGAAGAVGEQLREDIAHMIKGEGRANMRTMAAALDVEDRVKAAAPEVFEALAPLTNPYAKPGDGPNMAAATAPTTKNFHWKTAAVGFAAAAGIGILMATGLGVGLAVLTGVASPLIAGLLSGVGVHSAVVVGAHAVAATAAPGVIAGSAQATLSAGLGLMEIAGAGLGLGTFGGIYAGTDRGVMRKFMDKTRGLAYGEIKPREHDIHPVQLSVAKQPAIAPLSITTPLAALNADNAKDGSEKINKFVERFAKATTASAAKDTPDYWQKVAAGSEALDRMDVKEAIRH